MVSLACPFVESLARGLILVLFFGALLMVCRWLLIHLYSDYRHFNDMIHVFRRPEKILMSLISFYVIEDFNAHRARVLVKATIS